MGFIDTISNILSSWKDRKRKRTDETNDYDQRSKKRKEISSYTLTPGEKFNNDVKTQRTYTSKYLYDEEVRTTESRTYEFKAGGVLFAQDSFVHLIQKYASAFLNSEGGVILAGVRDDGVVKGVTITQSSRDNIIKTITAELSQFRPSVPHSWWDVKYVPVEFRNSRRPVFNTSDRYVVEISFKKGNEEDIYESGNHEVFLRRDGGVQGPLRPLDLKNIVINRYKETLIKRQRKNDEERSQRTRLLKKGIAYVVID